jgi:primosomal protein N' (replication factor Y)
VPELSAVQRAVSASLIEAVEARAFQPFLLDGVTGSGKTEVYFEAVAAAIRRAADAGPAARDRADRAVPHSASPSASACAGRVAFGLRQSQRRRAWRAIASGEALVTVGARSALFLPYPISA